jgi:hydrogenase-4 component F
MIAVTVAVAAPFGAALLAMLPSQPPVRRIVGSVLAVIAVVLALGALPQLDPLSALFVTLISVLSLLATLYSVSVFPPVELAATPWSGRRAYFVLLGAFWSSMLIAVTSTSFIGLWIGISATTLATTFLVGFSGGKAALEAAWKYLMLCSFGIAIALIGIFLLGHAALTAHLAPAVALSWDTLARNGGRLSPELARVALLLMLLGFGTKAGLVPMHSWLPDAHSKAPAAISALLSGLLVSCALYAIVRVQHVAAVVAPALFNDALLVLGSLSILVAATLMLAQRDIKRLLSYSTVEHAGLVAIALGLGTPLGEFAAIYHILTHAFTKSLAFLAVGVVQQERGTTTIGKLQGLWNDASGKFLLAALVGLTGLPPFGIFVSELLIVLAAAAAHQWAALACAVTGLLIAFIALARLAIDTESGTRVARSGEHRGRRAAFLVLGCATAVALLLAVIPFVSPIANGRALTLALGLR